MPVPSPTPRIAAIATAVPSSECDATYHAWALRQLDGRREAGLLDRMMQRSGIGRRFTVLSDDATYRAEGSFYDTPVAPSTLERMAVYAREAPELALEAIGKLGNLGKVTHMVVASCTGFTAPGLDQVIARRLGLAPTVERVVVGFMGCYAGVTALRTAGHIVRSQPHARVLVVSVELCTLHLQPTDRLESLLAMGQFADGAAAALVTAEGPGLALGDGLSLTLEDSHDLITWTIGDTGFAMELSGGRRGDRGPAGLGHRCLGDPSGRQVDRGRGRARPRPAAREGRRLARGAAGLRQHVLGDRAVRARAADEGAARHRDRARVRARTGDGRPAVRLDRKRCWLNGARPSS